MIGAAPLLAPGGPFWAILFLLFPLVRLPSFSRGHGCVVVREFRCARLSVQACMTGWSLCRAVTWTDAGNGAGSFDLASRAQGFFPSV